MDKVIIAGLLTIAGVITAVILFGGLTESVQEAGENTKTTMAQSEEQRKSGITILEVLVNSDGSEMTIRAKNTGSNEIRPLEKLDVFLLDIDGLWGDYITYSPTPSTNQNTWRVSRPANTIWKPGDTFQLLASLPANPLASNGYTLTITTPDFSKDEYRFDTGPVSLAPTPTPGPAITPTPTLTPTPTPIPSGSCTPTSPGAAPVLNSIATSTGYPRQMLAVNGDTSGASIVWNVDVPGVANPNEITITTGQGGTRYFQIPDNAAPAIYPVALRAGANTSNIVCVIVKPSSGAFPAPRIEDIGLNGRTGSDIAITISAANMDSDARLTVNGTEISARYLSSALPIPYLIDRIPATFGYPVYHYAQIRGIVSNPTIGSTLNVVITNHDGQSDSKSYTLPARWEDLDSDGDGLLDSWEDGIYTAPNGGTVNLRAMGTTKYKKDILLEADWTSLAAPGTASYDDDLWPFVIGVFANAPVLSPDGTAGVNLIIDHGQGGEFTEGGDVVTPGHTTMAMGTQCGGRAGCMNMVDYRDDYNGRPGFYNSARKGLFHYTIFANRHVRGAGGQAEFPSGNLGGDDMFCAMPWVSTTSFGECLAHELGHNIGLAHGGLTPWNTYDHSNAKVNFNSIMNYRYSYGGTPIGCRPVSGTGGPVTFSQGMLNPIVEASVDENKGICDNVRLDFNGDGLYTTGAMDIVDEYTGSVQEGRGSGTTLGTSRDYDQWGNMILDFRSCWNDTQGLVRRAECTP